MPSSKKKAKGKAKKGGTASSSGSSAAKPPRTNDEIVGDRRSCDPSRPPKKAVVRELYDSLMYEVNSEARAEIVAKVAALEQLTGEVSKEALAENEHISREIPITYETKEMVALMNERHKAMLTVGPVAPFHVTQVYHGRPNDLIGHFESTGDKESLVQAMRWTGQDPTIHVCFPQLSFLGMESMVFLGECFLDKEDVAFFAGRFAPGSGGSIYNWPNSNAVLQCPFTCKIAVPEKEKTASGESKRYVMVLQNIKQLALIDNNLHMPHRGLPRLCDREYFIKNLRGGMDFQRADGGIVGVPLPPDTEWCHYPKIMEEGIIFRAANEILPHTRLLATSSSEYLPSAYTLFHFYHECGMSAAVSQVIDKEQNRIGDSVLKSFRGSP